MTEAELDKLLQPYKDSNGNVKPKDVYRVLNLKYISLVSKIKRYESDHPWAKALQDLAIEQAETIEQLRRDIKEKTNDR